MMTSKHDLNCSYNATPHSLPLPSPSRFRIVSTDVLRTNMSTSEMVL